MLTFANAAPVCASQRWLAGCQRICTRVVTRPQRVCVRRRVRATVEALSVKSEGVAELKQRLHTALEGLDRGLNIDADDETTGEEEGDVEDLLEMLEERNEIEVPTTDERMFGLWEMVYTSSSITRYFGGATGLQRLLPEGEVGKIEQYIDGEDGSSEIRETIRFEMPVVGNVVEEVAVASGRIRATGAQRQIWEPKNVKFYFFKQFADSWKTLRAFQVSDTTYLDEDLRITRGQTGSVTVFRRAR